MTAGSDNPFPSILLAEHVDPATPPSGHWRLFVDTDNILKIIDDAGTVSAVGGGSSDLDAIITASSGQDIADALAGAAAPDSGNVFATMADVGGGGGNATYVSAYASPPSSPAAGDLWMPSDGYHDFLRYSGSVWVPHVGGVAGAIPSRSGWSWVNQGTGTVTTTSPADVIVATANEASGYKMRVRSAPSTPYTVTACIRAAVLPTGGAAGGAYALLHRQSSDGKAHMITVRIDVSTGHCWAEVDYWSGDTTFSTTLVGPLYNALPLSPYVSWLRVSDDGTNRKYFVSLDGRNFLQVYSVARTTTLTADQVGWGIRSSNSFAGIGTLLSWVEA